MMMMMMMAMSMMVMMMAMSEYDGDDSDDDQNYVSDDQLILATFRWGSNNRLNFSSSSPPLSS